MKYKVKKRKVRYTIGEEECTAFLNNNMITAHDSYQYLTLPKEAYIMTPLADM